MQRLGCLLGGLAILMLVVGCGGSKQKEAAVPTTPEVYTVDYENESHKMERITFAGGYLRTNTTLSPQNITQRLLMGSKGIIYGHRNINGKDWAKVTTREGETGWYCLEDDDKAVLDINTRDFIETYPHVNGPRADVAAKINSEINCYKEVFKYMAGPVGNPLRSRVTYNKKNKLSILFECPYISYRNFTTAEVNNVIKWHNWKKYCYISPLLAEARTGILYAQRVDMQYAMTFDLLTGNRLTYEEIVPGINERKLEQRAAALGENTRISNDDFYLNEQGQLVLLVEVNGKNLGREPLVWDGTGTNN